MDRMPDQSLDGLVIEASGIANPSVIQSLLVDSGMNRFYRLKNIISVTDPISFPTLQQTLPNIVQQIKSANHIILNKSDIVSTNAIEDVVLEIKKINNKSQIHVTKYCRINFNPLDSDEKRFGELSSDSVHGEDPAYAKYSIQIHRPLNLDRLKQLLKRNPNAFYRIKGIILDENENLQNLDYSVSSGLYLYPQQSKDQPHLEFIFAGENREKIIGELRLFSREGFIKEV
jgi:G3E family GTPase